MKVTAVREREEEARMCGVLLTVCSGVGQGQLFIHISRKVQCCSQSCDLRGDWLTVFVDSWLHQ